MSSDGAKGGFQNERDVIDSFNDRNQEALSWLQQMNVDLALVASVKAYKAPPRVKPDVVVEVYGAAGNLISKLLISVKLSSNARGFNQIDRGKVVQRYKGLWQHLSADAETGLRLFTGDLPPVKPSRNSKRMFIDELGGMQKQSIIDFFSTNKLQVVSDLLAGRQPMKAEWLLTVDKSSQNSKVFVMDDAVTFYASGSVEVSKKGSLNIGRITAQRKGGDGGAPSANDLQFKFDPNEILRSIH